MRCSSHALTLAAVLVSGCGDSTGAVELAWVFVDRGGEPIFPGGVFSLEDERDTCGLPGQLGPEGERVSYDLRVQLEICDPEACEDGCESEECLVLPRRLFGCNTSRGNEPEVEASDSAYRFTLRTLLTSDALQSECVDPSCLAIPSPRERTMAAGRVIDLQVYQIVVDVDRASGEALDLEACDCE